MGNPESQKNDKILLQLQEKIVNPKSRANGSATKKNECKFVQHVSAVRFVQMCNAFTILNFRQFFLCCFSNSFCCFV